MPQDTRPRSSSTRRWLALAAASTTVIAFSASAGAALAAKDPDEWVTICHRTNSTKNPYVQITVKRSAVDGVNGKGEGQGDHFGQHKGPVWDPSMPNGGDWGDIIPPVLGAHSGLNWDARGQAIYDAGCNALALTTDSDNDGTPDATDPDDDNDGTPDLTDPTEDTDGDGIPDTSDTDDDGDGTPDATDPTHDGDNDGTPDTTDSDDDNDGTPDTTDSDDDGDGTPDAIDPDADPDNDGTPNATDPDNNNDGTPDTAEPDLDEDGTPDYSDTDDDGDGIPDAVDPDDDGDGTPDNVDNPDTDSDGTPDATDTDDDSDGTPDVKDPDSNGDGIEETERQRVDDASVPDRIVPGKEIRIGDPDYTDVGMQVTYRVTCSPLHSSRAVPRGDIDSGGQTPLCVIKKRGTSVTLKVVSADPVKVRIVGSAGAIATFKGYKKVYVFTTG